VDEREVVRKWRALFQGQAVTPEVLAEAEDLLDGLGGESPLHVRLGAELAELQRGPKAPKKKRPASRRKA
jgi:hypothetical protein